MTYNVNVLAQSDLPGEEIVAAVQESLDSGAIPGAVSASITGSDGAGRYFGRSLTPSSADAEPPVDGDVGGEG